MRSHWTPVLIFCALALAGCQPSNNGAAQTQAVQTAFSAAVDAAATQAAPPPPTPTAAPTLGPSPTQSAKQLKGMAASFQGYLARKVDRFHPADGSAYDAHVIFVQYEYYDNGNAAVMDVGVQKSDATDEVNAQGAVLKAFTAVYGPAHDEDAWSQGLVLPPQLRVFRIHTYGPDNKEHFRASGDWADVIACGQGSLSAEEFVHRVKFEIAVE